MVKYNTEEIAYGFLILNHKLPRNQPTMADTSNIKVLSDEDLAKKIDELTAAIGRTSAEALKKALQQEKEAADQEATERAVKALRSLREGRDLALTNARSASNLEKAARKEINVVQSALTAFEGDGDLRKVKRFLFEHRVHVKGINDNAKFPALPQTGDED